MPTPTTLIVSTTPRQRLLAGKRLIGCWCSLANPITTEVLGVAGFDWLLLDGEHSPERREQLHPAADGAEGQPQRARGAAAQQQHRRDQALARCGVLQLPGSFCRERRGSAARCRRYALSAPGHTRRVGVPAQQPLRHGAGATSRASTTRSAVDRCRSRAAPVSRPSRDDRGRWTAWTPFLSARPTWRPASGHLGNPSHPDVQEAIAAVSANGLQACGKPIGHPGAGGSRRAALHGDGRHLCGRGQRPRCVPLRDARPCTVPSA